MGKLFCTGFYTAWCTTRSFGDWWHRVAFVFIVGHGFVWGYGRSRYTSCRLTWISLPFSSNWYTNVDVPMSAMFYSEQVSRRMKVIEQCGADCQICRGMKSTNAPSNRPLAVKYAPDKLMSRGSGRQGLVCFLAATFPMQWYACSSSMSMRECSTAIIWSALFYSHWPFVLQSERFMAQCLSKCCLASADSNWILSHKKLSENRNKKLMRYLRLDWRSTTYSLLILSFSWLLMVQTAVSKI